MTETESIINDCDLVDRISDLPDSILGLILSFLPTKKAVATSILSKRWKFAWVSIHNLDFHYNSGIVRTKFIRYVNHVLLLHDAGLLNKFSLFWNIGCISSRVTSWVNTAITKNVCELSLFVSPDHGLFEMPTSVFNCNSLRSLDLGGDIYVSAAIPIFLPRLQTLKLDQVHFPTEEALENLISGCPTLNHLELKIETYTSFMNSIILHRDNDESNESEKWNPLEQAARCLSNSLKTVSFYCRRSYDVDRKMIRYILKHGSALEVMKIHCCWMIVRDGGIVADSPMSKLVKEIREFPRKSPICEVEFILGRRN